MNYIVVKYKAPGFHRWADAPDHRDYLACPHRHLFTYVVKLGVKHDERDVEFHDLIDFIDDCIVVNYKDDSCEKIARTLRLDVIHKWPDRWCEVEVWEDDECGAVVSE